MAERRQLIGRLGVAAVLIAVVATLYFSPARDYFTLEYARVAIADLRALWYGPLILILLYGIGTVFALPATLFVCLSGIIWGPLLGGIYGLIGGCLGATLSFFVARFIGGGVLARAGKRGARLEKHLETAGFSTMLALRLIPGVPFPVLNYAAGVARVPFRDYFLSTLIGSAPAHFVLAYSAHAIAGNTLSGRQAFYRLLLAGVLMGALVFIPMAIKRRLERKGGDSNPLPDLEG